MSKSSMGGSCSKAGIWEGILICVGYIYACKAQLSYTKRVNCISISINQLNCLSFAIQSIKKFKPRRYHIGDLMQVIVFQMIFSQSTNSVTVLVIIILYLNFREASMSSLHLGDLKQTVFLLSLAPNFH